MRQAPVDVEHPETTQQVSIARSDALAKAISHAYS